MKWIESRTEKCFEMANDTGVVWLVCMRADCKMILEHIVKK